MPRELIDKLFELGIMGIEVPEQLRRRRRHVLPLRPRGRSAVARRPLGRRARRRPEHAGHQRPPALGHRRDQAHATCPSSPRAPSAPTACRRPAPAATRSRSRRAPSRRGDGFALTGRKLWITNGNEADLFIVFATINPEAGYRGITAFLVERGMAGFTVGKKEDKLGIRASSTCELLFEDCGVPKCERPRRGRQGLQGGDRDPQRGAYRHRRADGRPRAGRARSHDRAT